MTAPIYTVSALAAKWGVSTTFIYTMLQTGELSGFKLGGKLWRIRASEVEAYECRNLTQ